jgi:hypothetical protein
VAQARRVNLLDKKNPKPISASRASQKRGVITVPVSKVYCSTETGIMSGGSWSPPQKGAPTKRKTQQIYDDFALCAKMKAPWCTPFMAAKHDVALPYLRTLHTRFEKKTKRS